MLTWSSYPGDSLINTSPHRSKYTRSLPRKKPASCHSNSRLLRLKKNSRIRIRNPGSTRTWSTIHFHQVFIEASTRSTARFRSPWTRHPNVAVASKLCILKRLELRLKPQWEVIYRPHGQIISQKKTVETSSASLRPCTEKNLRKTWNFWNKR